MRYISDETIVALSTATGGAISVIRMTGPKAISIADTCFSKSIIDKEANTTTLGNIVDEKGRVIDNVVVALWKAPHSYTG